MKIYLENGEKMAEIKNADRKKGKILKRKKLKGKAKKFRKNALEK